MQRRNRTWRRSSARWGVMIFWLLFSLEAKSEELPLSLEDALTRAERYAPELVRARNELLNTEARRTGAGLLLPSNPVVSVLVGSRREEQAGGGALYGIQHQLHIEQTLEVAGQRWTRLAAVAAAVAVQRDAVAYARLLSRAVVKALYVQCVLVEQRLAVAQRREDVARQLLQSAQTRVQLGAAGAIDVNLALIEAGRVAGDRLEIAAEQEARLGELRILTAVPPGTPLKLTAQQVGGAPPAIVSELDVNQQIERALVQRSDLRAVHGQKAQLQAEQRRLRREITPNPFIAFDYQQDLPGQIFLGGTVGLTLPVFNRNQGPLAQLEAAKRVRQAEENLVVTRIRTEVAQALRILRLRQTQLELFAREALPPAEENVDLLRRGWQAGKFDLFRVIAALRERTEVKTRYLTMLEQLWLAAISLERASGTEIIDLPGSPGR
ncbi:MAG TPA: TolC family protein [Pseudomonadota bacterium]|nr:TolC family protein [Pseudomonadota bacterium]